MWDTFLEILGRADYKLAALIAAATGKIEEIDENELKPGKATSRVAMMVTVPDSLWTAYRTFPRGKRSVLVERILLSYLQLLEHHLHRGVETPLPK